jgi:ABC-type uncharacterized transport system substrate-binding protein
MQDDNKEYTMIASNQNRMTRRRSNLSLLLLSVLLLMVGVMLNSCTSTTMADPDNNETAADAAATQPYTGKKIVWVDSYHAEYEWSAEIEEGVRNALDGSGVELEVIHMDTKLNPGDGFGQQAGQDANAAIAAFNPDIVIACDDNAQKYLVMPFLNDSGTPVVFCGVNWDAARYDFSTDNVTGVVEVELPDRVVEILKPYAQGERIAYLTVASETENNVAEIYNERFFDGEMKVYAVDTLEEFKAAFLQAQEEVDILFMGNNAGIADWDEAEMKAFILENSQIPSGTINSWMTPYSLLSVAKYGEEQGELSVQAALSILDGTAVSNIPVTENKEGRLILNLDMAEKLNIVFAPSVLRNAEVLSSAEGN